MTQNQTAMSAVRYGLGIIIIIVAVALFTSTAYHLQAVGNLFLGIALILQAEADKYHDEPGKRKMLVNSASVLLLIYAATAFYDLYRRI